MPDQTQRDAERSVEELRKRFTPLLARLTPEVEPAVVFSCAPMKLTFDTEPEASAPPNPSGFSLEPDK